MRNKSSKMLGKWIIRSAQLSERKHSDVRPLKAIGALVFLY